MNPVELARYYVTNAVQAVTCGRRADMAALLALTGALDAIAEIERTYSPPLLLPADAVVIDQAPAAVAVRRNGTHVTVTWDECGSVPWRGGDFDDQC